MLQILKDIFFSYPSYFTIVTITIIFFLFKSLSLKKTHNNGKNKNISPPPSPPSMPIIGNLHQLGSQPHRALQTLSRRHGPDLMLLHLGSVPVVIVSSAKAAKEVMKTHDLAIADRPKATCFEKLLYNYRDLATAPYGEYWRRMKSIAVLHLLSNKRVHSFRRVREEETKLMVENIRQNCGNGSNSAVNLSELFAGLANDVVCKASLGRKYGDSESGKNFKKLLGEFTELLGSFNVGDYIPMLSWLSKVNGLEARMDKVAKEFDEFLERVVEEHMRLDFSEDYEDNKNFVEILLWVQRENSLGVPVDRTCIKALLLDMFAAGTDTTQTALEWTMTELLTHPNAMKKLQTEIRTIVGEKNDVDEDDLDEMPYLKAVFKESLRLHPPIPLLLPRVSTQDVEIMGYDVVSGSQVFINAWAIGRDPSVWDDPWDFRPERFLDSEVDYKGHDFELIPFGAGRRGCPGTQFAMAVNEIALANVVHKFDWSLPSSDLDMTETIGLTVRRKFPLMALPNLVITN